MVAYAAEIIAVFTSGVDNAVSIYTWIDFFSEILHSVDRGELESH